MTHLTRKAFLGAVLLAAACGNKQSAGPCDKIPPDPSCNIACSATPGAPNTCPAGFHCTPDGKCDAQCTPGGTQCGDGFMCTVDGACVASNYDAQPIIDANCPAVHFNATGVTPSIQLLIDRSGSMSQSFAGGGVSKYQAIADALVGPTGVVTALQAHVYFGAALFTSDTAPTCPTLYSQARALNNETAIAALINGQSPGGSTPTPPSIDQTVADFMSHPPPTGSPPIIVLATDGAPNSCNNTGTTTEAESVAAAKAAYAKGIRLFILGVGDQVTAQHLQDMANAGQGIVPPMPNATAYSANSPAALAAAFQQIIGGVLSCDLTLTGQIDPAQAASGQVKLNGAILTYGTDWTVVNGTTIQLLGTACTTLKNSTNPTVDASFPCGAVIF
jgi:hypothetical protein